MQPASPNTIVIPGYRAPAIGDGLARDLQFLLLGLLMLVVWEVSGLDLPLERLWGDGNGFAWREHWITSGVLHSGARLLAWTILALMLVALKWPPKFAKTLSRRDRLWLVGTTLFCVALIPLLKRFSATSCPWALAEFGGGVAHYVPHWLLGQYDGGPGGCFPSGHASTAFAFLGGWFVLRGSQPRAARIWLAITLVCGMALGWTQMVRGAHYLSHSMWTAWLCWAVALLSFHISSPWRQQSHPRANPW